MPSKSSLETKQDLTERRRLQNRLSQRNHRRKIRDRIAKLQERVIASELRAAATLHGWHSAPCIPYEVQPSPSSSSSSSSAYSASVSSSPSHLCVSSSSSSSSSSPIAPTPTTTSASSPAMTDIPYPISTTPSTAGPAGICSSCSSITPLPTLSEYNPTPPISNICPVPVNQSSSNPNNNNPSTEFAQYATTEPSLVMEPSVSAQMYAQWGFRGSLYVATETSFPQIMQAVGPTANVIVLVPRGDPGFEYGAQQQQREVADVDMGMGVGIGIGMGMGFNGDVQCQGQYQEFGWVGCPVHAMGYS